MRRALLGFALAGALAGCAVHVSDTSFIKPQVAGVLDAVTTSTMLPTGYSVSTDFISSADGEKLYRARFTHPDSKSVVVFFNGNLSTVEKHAAQTAAKLAKDWHPDFVFVDYRGYGQSSGKPTLEMLQADALRVFEDEQRRARSSSKKIVLAGYSIGGVVAGAVLETLRPDAALFIATVTDVKDMMALVMPAYTKLFFRVSVDPRLDAIDNRRSLSKYSGPLLVVAAERDSQTPAAMSKALFEAGATPPTHKQLVIANAAQHNDILDAIEFRDALRLFVTKHGL